MELYISFKSQLTASIGSLTSWHLAYISFMIKEGKHKPHAQVFGFQGWCQEKLIPQVKFISRFEWAQNNRNKQANPPVYSHTSDAKIFLVLPLSELYAPYADFIRYPMDMAGTTEHFHMHKTFAKLTVQIYRPLHYWITMIIAYIIWL